MKRRSRARYHIRVQRRRRMRERNTQLGERKFHNSSRPGNKYYRNKVRAASKLEIPSEHAHLSI